MDKQDIKAYFALIKAAIMGRMEYRATFIMFLFTLIGFYGSQIAVIVFMLERFKKIGGWEPGQIAFLYCLLVFAQGVVAVFFSGMLEFSDFVKQGTFDRVMLRPLSPLLQVLCQRFELAGVANLILGIAGLIVASSMITIDWNLFSVVFLLLSVCGGALILAAVRIIVAAVAFVSVSNEGLQHLVVFSSREFLMYPVEIFTKPVRFLLTFLFPIAFINFYPAHFFLHKEATVMYHPILIYITFPVGVLMMILALISWRMGVNRYASAGG